MTPDHLLRAPKMDRSMNRVEYMHWRKVTRSTRHLRPVMWYSAMEPKPVVRAEETAHWRRVARQMAIHVRVCRNKARLGLPR